MIEGNLVETQRLASTGILFSAFRKPNISVEKGQSQQITFYCIFFPIFKFSHLFKKIGVFRKYFYFNHILHQVYNNLVMKKNEVKNCMISTESCNWQAYVTKNTRID